MPDTMSAGKTRRVLGGLVGAQPSDIGFVPNATHGTNAVLASYPLSAGDEIVIAARSTDRRSHPR